ncbi:hypothetical protein [Gluconobacter cerinus]|nr:hypothetical protein [Gluconobacter cerinus]
MTTDAQARHSAGAVRFCALIDVNAYGNWRRLASMSSPATI